MTIKNKARKTRDAPSSPAESHPYLEGNFAPVHTTYPLTPCTFTGEIPASLAGGQYVRNGANPLLNDDQDRPCHWFDGDGMLTGVLFRRAGEKIQPEFVNNWVETDVFKASQSFLKSDPRTSWFKWPWRLTRPITPSITTLISPYVGAWTVVAEILRTILICILSLFPWSPVKIRKVSVANTAILYHDGRALATCESGPPMRVELPELQTVGWFNGATVEAEEATEEEHQRRPFAGVMQMTTAHPKVDDDTGEMILFHNMFTAPYVEYSVIPAARIPTTGAQAIMNASVPGMTSAKLMHDFGVSARHSIILDLPLSINPLNMVKNKPLFQYDSDQRCRFGVFPRHHPESVLWFEDDACIISHTACTWDEHVDGRLTAVCMLACRMTAPDIFYRTGNLTPPMRPSTLKGQFNPRSRYSEEESVDEKIGLLESDTTREDYQDHTCRLHYFRFSLGDRYPQLRPSHSFSLSAVDMEFPTVAPGMMTQEAHFVYGCSSRFTCLNSVDASAVKIDVITKMDVQDLVHRGRTRSRESNEPVDTRSISDLVHQRDNNNAAVQLFPLPFGVYAGEPRFVPNGVEEDDGHLLFFTFNEAQLLPTGQALNNSISELWILNARTMTDVVAKIQLIQRVPYGLHGEWFSEEQIRCQRAWDTKRLRNISNV